MIKLSLYLFFKEIFIKQISNNLFRTKKVLFIGYISSTTILIDALVKNALKFGILIV